METPEYRTGLFYRCSTDSCSRKLFIVEKQENQELWNLDYRSCGIMGFNLTIKNASRGKRVFIVLMVISNNLQSIFPLDKSKKIICKVDCTYILLQLSCLIREVRQAEYPGSYLTLRNFRDNKLGHVSLLLSKWNYVLKCVLFNNEHNLFELSLYNISDMKH